MNLLAITLSARTGSAALLRDDRIVQAESCEDRVGKGPTLFRALSHILEKAGLAGGGIDFLAVDLGPGRYSGLRIGLTAAQAFALPDHARVYGVSCGDILAAEFFDATVMTRLGVIGDARRNRLWCGFFGLENGLPVAEPDGWHLLTVEELAASLDGETRLVSPDVQSLIPALQAAGLADRLLVHENAPPQASVLARLVSRRVALNVPSLPLQPIYMHPPVFVKPRFAAP